MPEFLPDPEMEQLVHELNRLAEHRASQGPPEEEGSLPILDAPTLRNVVTGEKLAELLQEMVERGASDLLVIPGSVPIIRAAGRLERLQADSIESDSVRGMFANHLGARSRQRLAETGAADFSLTFPSLEAGGNDVRLRVNLHRQRGRLAAAVRALPQRVPALEELQLPSSLLDLVRPTHGLLLVCGPTGSGKTTTIAALLDHLNRTDLRHVITIEEPVEYVHSDRRAVFEQVEVGSDAPSFAAALRSALRRDPDVILVGEMRDLETMATAITAAETGHLILATLHTSDSAQAVHRIIDVFPASQQTQIRQQLALSLSAIVCQQLVPTTDGRGRLPAVEVLLATYAVRNHIRRGNLERLYNELMSGRGMMSMEHSLAQLVQSGRVAADEARMRSSRPDELGRLLGG